MLFRRHQTSARRRLNGEAMATGRIVEIDRAFVPGVRAIVRKGAASNAPPGRFDRHLVCLRDGMWLDGLAHRSALFFAQDLPSKYPAKVSPGLVAADARVIFCDAAQCRSTRLIQSAGRLQRSKDALRGPQAGPNSTDRGWSGSKHFLLSDARGASLVIQLEAAYRHYVNTLLPLAFSYSRLPACQDGHDRNWGQLSPTRQGL